MCANQSNNCGPNNVKSKTTRTQLLMLQGLCRLVMGQWGSPPPFFAAPQGWGGWANSTVITVYCAKYCGVVTAPVGPLVAAHL